MTQSSPQHRRQLSRRRLASFAGGAIGALLAGSTRAAQDPRVKVNREAGWYVSPEHAFTVTWDPGLWYLAWEPAVTNVALFNLAKTSTQDDGWFLGATTLKREWASIGDAEATAIDDWFSQGMLDATILETWSGPTAYAWAHASASSNTLAYLEYTPTDVDGRWRELAISIDAGAFTPATAGELIPAVQVDGNDIPQAVTLDELVALLEAHAAR